MMKAPEKTDVAILGGGLAGLTLALQLRGEDPDREITVLERNTMPPPAAAFKVGESVVEIGAHYLSQVLGLEDLLVKTQLPKFGLRFFFGSKSQADFAQTDELGVSTQLPVDTYQLDRGLLEGDLVRLAEEKNIHVITGATVKRVALNQDTATHRVEFRNGEAAKAISCSWVVDAAARAAILKRQLGLERSIAHNINSAWFRLDQSVDIDDWSGNPAWKSRTDTARRFSTNQLMGSGYWVWLIPLPGDRTSVGIVADPDLHPLEGFKTFSRSLDWLGDHQPHCAEALAGQSENLMDFRFLKHFSHDSARLWSPDRWAQTGEAGVFADPLYSPGTDFIAIANTFISHLIAREGQGGEIKTESRIFEQLYKSFFSNTMSIYEGLYPGFGDRRLMVLKSTWDYAFYWSVLAFLFFRQCITNLPLMKELEPTLLRMQQINRGMQARFRAAAAMKTEYPADGRYFDQCAIPLLVQLNGELLEPGPSVHAELARNAGRLERLAVSLETELGAGSDAPMIECDLLGDLRYRLRG